MGENRPSGVVERGGLMLREFKDFLFRGNIVELAVAFVIGVAFAALINSFVENLVMPVIAAIIGKPDFSDLTFTINDAVFRYGAFLTAVIQFVAIAAAVFFFVVKPVDAMLARRRREPVEEGMPDEERRHQELLAALARVGR
jgi:large conductance mechanosensitive channel